MLAAHYFLAYVEKFQRDRERLADCRKRVNVLPLGAAALAGTSLPIDRESVRQKLGFDAVARNSLDVSSDRDFLLEFVFDLSLIATHLSGWAEEWVIWSHDGVQLPRPAGRVLHRVEHHAAQEEPGRAGTDPRQDRPRDRRAATTPRAREGAAAGVQPRPAGRQDRGCSTRSTRWPRAWRWPRRSCAQTKLRREVIAARLEDGFLDATTLMEGLIARGVPMRSAHEAVGKLVRECEQRKCRLADLPDAMFDAVVPGRGAEVRGTLGVANALAAFKSYGSTAPAEVAKQVAEWKTRLNEMT